MSCLWTYLSLIYVTTFLQNSVSSNEGVSLDCNKTVEVAPGGTVTVNCTYFEKSCKALRYLWSNTRGEIPCNPDSMKHGQWNSRSYVSLTLSDVVVEDEYTLRMETDCPRVETSAVKVQVKELFTTTSAIPTTPQMYNSLNCDKTVEVVAGGTVTLNCTYMGQRCNVQRYIWRNRQGEIQCNSDFMGHGRGWDNLTYVSLTISDVVKEENYTVSVKTDCETVETSVVEVQVKGELISSVSLNCSTTVEVEAGEAVTLNCSIISDMEQSCRAVDYEWKSQQDQIPCNISKYSCEWDKLSYVSLTIPNVTEEENYTASILTDCGGRASSVIQVKLSNSTGGISEKATEFQVIYAVSRYFTLVILATLFFFCGTERGRRMVNCIKQEKTQEYPSDIDTGPE